MNQLWKIFLFFCFAVFFLSGCSKPVSNQAQVKAVIGAGDKSEKEGKEKIDISAMPEEEKAEVMLMAEDVKALLKMNKRANEVFNQIWNVYWNDFTLRMNNPFLAMRNSLLTGFADDGIPLKVQSKQRCQGAELNVAGYSPLQKEKLQIKSPNAYSLIEGTCAKAAGKVMAEIKMVNDESGKYYLISYSRDAMLIGNSLELFGSPLLDKADISGKKFKFSKEDVLCKLYPDGSGSLKKMECFNLGQNQNSVNFLSLNYILWDAANPDLQLKVQGMSLTTGEEGAKVISVFKITDASSQNTVNIEEKLISSDEDKSRKVQKPIEKPVEKPTQDANSNSQEPMPISGDQAVAEDPSTQELSIVR